MPGSPTPCAYIHGWLFLVPVGALLGCVTPPAPLPRTASLAPAPEHVPVEPRHLPAPRLRAHPFRPENGLDVTEVAQLAVANNPALRAERRRAGIASAEVFAARLLPDPQLALTGELPTHAGPGITKAWSAELDWDLRRLVTRGAGIDAAREAARQVDLEILWAEWQVIQRARVLFVRVLQARQDLELVRRVRELFAARYARSSKALEQGDLTLDVVGTDLTALLDANTMLTDHARTLDQREHDLDALLGLAPTVRLELTASPTPPAPDDATVRRALADLPSRRPDLLALRAGVRSEEAKFREAVLGRFPPLSIGVLAATDTSDVQTVGVALTVALPFLDGNRGEVAITRGTREQLRAAFSARLDETTSEVDLLRSEDRIIEAQLARVKANLPTLERMVAQARHAYEVGDIGALTYLNMENTLLGKQLEASDLKAALWETRITLDTLLGRAVAGSEAPGGETP